MRGTLSLGKSGPGASNHYSFRPWTAPISSTLMRLPGRQSGANKRPPIQILGDHEKCSGHGCEFFSLSKDTGNRPPGLLDA